MAATLQQLQERRDRLKQALASGAQSTSYGDYHKTFRSVEEIREAIADVESDIAALGGGPIASRAYRFHTRKGL